MQSAMVPTSQAQSFCESLYPTATAYLETFFASHLHAQGYSFDADQISKIALHYAQDAIRAGLVAVVRATDLPQTTNIFVTPEEAQALVGKPIQTFDGAAMNGPFAQNQVVHPYPFAGGQYAV
jgi:hypothetical protein